MSKSERKLNFFYKLYIVRNNNNKNNNKKRRNSIDDFNQVHRELNEHLSSRAQHFLFSRNPIGPLVSKC